MGKMTPSTTKISKNTPFSMKWSLYGVLTLLNINSIFAEITPPTFVAAVITTGNADDLVANDIIGFQLNTLPTTQLEGVGVVFGKFASYKASTLLLLSASIKKDETDFKEAIKQEKVAREGLAKGKLVEGQ